MKRLLFVIASCLIFTSAIADTVYVPLFQFWDPTNAVGTLNEWIVDDLDPVLNSLAGIGGGVINVPPTGTTSITGTCPNGYNLFNNSGAVGCQANGGGGGSPGGASGSIQYNNGGAFGGLTNPLPIANGGTGSATPSGVIAGSNVTVTGSFPNQTVSSSGVANPLPIANGGTGSASPSGVIAGSNVTVTGSFPNQTVSSSGGGGGSLSLTDGSTTVSGVTGLTVNGATVSGSTPNGIISITGGGTTTNFTTHAALISGTTAFSTSTITQAGFYASGDGGDAIYQWNATSVCPTGAYGASGGAADGLSCILPSGQSAGTPGRYLLTYNTAINARAFGLQPGIGTAFDNSPLLLPLMAAVGPPGLGVGMDINFPPTMGQTYTSYYFSSPFEITHGTSIRCSDLTLGTSSFGSKVEFVFPAGVSGLIQENFHLAAAGSGDFGSTATGCNIGSVDHYGTPNSPGNADPGANVINHVLPGPAPVAWDGSFPDLAVGDGIFVVGSVSPINGGTLVKAPSGGGGAYVYALGGSSGNQNVTLPPSWVIGPQGTYSGLSTSSASIWRLPANEVYSVAATIHSSNADITGGRRPLKVGAWVWSEAFLFGTVMMQENNQVIVSPLPTVAAGGLGYVGASGTMTWAGTGCATPPVLNVTTSGGAINAVTGVANAGRCDGAWPSSSATTWTPGGGLSVGTGAKFNLLFINHAVMSTMAGSSYPAPALESGTFNLWTLPAGLTRRETSHSRSMLIEDFPIGLEMYCDNASGFGTGCANSQDQGDSIQGGSIGRYVTGSDCAPSTASSNIYGSNPITDIVDTCTLSNLYLNENTNSPENNAGKYSVLASCGFEGSTYVGGYISGNSNTDGFCLGTDTNGSMNIGVPTKPLDIVSQSNSLAVGVGVPGTPIVTGNGTMIGAFSFTGYSSKTEKASAPVTAGNAVVALASAFGQLAVGMTVTDLDHPTAIPGSTTVASFSGVNVTLSNNVASPGISTDDRIVFTTSTPGCTQIASGVDMLWSMSSTCDGGGSQYDLGTTYNPSLATWTINNLWIPISSYKGYNGGENLVLPGGIAVGGESWSLGFERMITVSPSSYATDTHLPGDFTFNRDPVSGGNVGWSYGPTFATTFSANVTAGVTTTFAIGACPSPSLPAGTPVISRFVDVAKRIGDLSSCSGGNLTLQAPALTNATNGWPLEFLASFPAGTIRDNDLATISSCGGGSPSVTAGSDNVAGQFTTGTGTPSACTITFAHAYPAAAFCTITPSSSGSAAITGGYYLTQTRFGFTINLGTGTSSVGFDYTCGGK